MIDLKHLRAEPDLYREASVNKRIAVDVDALLKLDGEHRRLLTEQQNLLAEKNRIGKEIGQLAGRLKKADAATQASLRDQMAALQQRPAEIKKEEQGIEMQLADLEPRLEDLLLRVPQPPDEGVPVGRDDADNIELRRWGQPRTFGFEPRDHVALGEALGVIDIERAVKLAGTRSYVLRGAGMRLHQAVLHLALDMMVDRGFEPMTIPTIVRQDAMQGTGYLPAGRDQCYVMEQEDPTLFLIGTAEVPLTAFHMNEVLEEADLPKKYVSWSSCYRREAGTYGKDTSGLYRIHQFEKVEQVIVCRADAAESVRWHEQILSNAEAVLQVLDLPYRVVHVCTGDLGMGQAAKFDIETWMPSRDSYGETHSASRFYDFQARRLRLRYRDRDGQVRLCHTLNNTVIASPRILIPLLELNQNEDGSVTVPGALRPYLGGQERIGP